MAAKEELDYSKWKRYQENITTDMRSTLNQLVWRGTKGNMSSILSEESLLSIAPKE